MKKGTYKRQTSTTASRSLTRSPSRSRSRSSANTFQTSNLELMLNKSDGKVLRPSRHLPQMPHATDTMDNLKKSLPIEEQVAYPRSVGFIIGNEFCERFNYYGMRTILVLYLTNKLGYNEETSTVLFHIFTMLVYIFPLIGALIADGWLGKYKTILYLSMVYSVGTLIVSFGAIPLSAMPTKAVTILGLTLIAIGTGGIKPCVSAFGGDQFVLPQQTMQLAKFFSLFYFAINAGSMISTTVTPILRADVHCFGEGDCFSLAFGIPAILMIVSVVIFVAGKKRYQINEPAGNMIFGVSQCIIDAFKGWRKFRKTDPMPSFLDYARHSVGAKMVHETKSLARILILYLPFPIFWALFDQQGSRWTFQATRMDGLVLGFQIKPDQMQVVNPLLILAFIPLFDYIIYPLLAKVGLRRPLQKLTVGLLLAALGFFMSAALEMKMEQAASGALPNSPQIAHLRLYNGMPCRYEFISNLSPRTSAQDPSSRSIDPLHMWSDLSLVVQEPTQYTFTAHDPAGKCAKIQGRLHLRPGKATSYFLDDNGLHEFDDGLNSIPNINSPPLLRALINTPKNEGPIMLKGSGDWLQPLSLENRSLSELHKVGFGELNINGKRAASFQPKNGGLYSLLVNGDAALGYAYNLLEVVPPPTAVSILWQLPQIIAMTTAEIMFSVTGLEFSFTQAPQSMKSVLQACWLLSVAIGNLIVVVIAEFKLASSQSGEFTLFAFLMLVDMVLFLWLARNYQYKDQAQESEIPDDDKSVGKPQTSEITSQSKDQSNLRQGGGMYYEPGYGSYRNNAYDNDISEA
ncbi:peptide transporter family 1 isoform X1 [Drosophila miranda]|uniref:peptide transporter family 1 isoform X1 n=1 Tax=Drosophila miranda TaxID=7229 RepID=UPI00143F211E|nr:peptide transporter family 1 isoform X1 [Drosophila miranda]